METKDIYKIIDEIWIRSKSNLSLDEFKNILKSWNEPISTVTDISSNNIIELYTDGGCRKNQSEGEGLGAWAVYNVTLDKKFFGYQDSTTNNRMELYAVYQGLLSLFNSELAVGQFDTIRVYSDSTYVVNTFNQWVWTWLRSGDIMEKKNYSLILNIVSLIRLLKMNEFTVQFIKVKGHSDIKGNIIADELVNHSMDNLTSEEYKIDLEDIKKTLISYIYSTAKIEIVDGNIEIEDLNWNYDPEKFKWYTKLTGNLSQLGIELKVKD